MSNFVIPTIFQAVDRQSDVIQKIENKTRSLLRVTETSSLYTSRANIHVENQERLFRRLTPALSEASKQLLSYIKTAALITGVTALLSFSVNKMMEYEDAVASFRTIVADLNNNEFAKFKDEIQRVAYVTKKSTVDVANSFEKIAGLNESFASTAEGLGKISEASIVLAKASGMELGEAAESLTSIMNQFNFSAEEAMRTINVLAAGQGKGAASIAQSAESYKNFGSVAKGANITLEQSMALIQTLASRQIMGAEAGTKLRGVVLQLQKAGLGYNSGTFQLNDALNDVTKTMGKFSSEADRNKYLIKLFGAENITAGKILLDNIEFYNTMTDAVTGSNDAIEQASIKTATLSNILDEAKARWVNILTSTNEASSSLNMVKGAIVLVTDNMETFIAVGMTILGLFLIWKAYIIAAKFAMVAYNIVYGIYIALSAKSALFTAGNTVAYGAYRATIIAGTIATKAATAAQWLWNAALTANPIGIVIMLIGLLVAAIAWVVSKTKGWGEQWDEVLDFMSAGFKLYWALLKFGFQSIVYAFTSMGFSIYEKWLWLQNKLGVLSDEFYNSELKRIEGIKNAQLSAMQETMEEMNKHSTRLRQGIDWKVTWDDGDSPENSTASTTGPLLNPYTAQANANTQVIEKREKQQLELLVKTDNNSEVDVIKNTGNIPINLTPSFGGMKI